MIYGIEFLDKYGAVRYNSTYCREILSSNLVSFFPIRVRRLQSSVFVSKSYMPHFVRILFDKFKIEFLSRKEKIIYVDGIIDNPYDIGAIFYLFKADVNSDNPMIETGLRKVGDEDNADLYTRMFISLRDKISNETLNRVHFSFGHGPRSFIMRYLINLVSGNMLDWIDVATEEINSLIESFKTNRPELIDEFLFYFYSSDIFDPNFKLKVEV
ncbi:MAG: hypothetical protein QXF12_04275 [Candidatus Aenigmatarchaeota archaeon]